MLAIDTESEYSKHLCIQTHGVGRYVRETKHYLVAGYDGSHAFVMQPPFDTTKLEGWAECCAHNAAYDGQVLEQLGLDKHHGPLLCTADAAAYHQHPRALKGVMKTLFNIELDKGLRDFMKGKAWSSLPPSIKEKIAEYCLLDAKASWHVAQQLFSTWPDHERKLSQHTAMMCRRGVQVDVEALTEDVAVMEQEVFECEKNIPWANDEKPTSPIALAKECRRLGITPPATTEADSPEFEQWLEKHSKDAPFVEYVCRWRKVNRLLQLCKTMLFRQIDGTLIYSLKYCGSPSTGRFAGESGLNMLNMPRAGTVVRGRDINIRNRIIPRPGHRFVVGDLAQIEARIALWLANDTGMLEVLSDLSRDLYDYAARRMFGYSHPDPIKESNPELRKLYKTAVLGLGFGMGWEKFIGTAWDWYGLTVDEATAKRTVTTWRRDNKRITDLWGRLEKMFRDSVGGSFEMERPSGNKCRYFNVQTVKNRGLAGVDEVGGKELKYMWGGKIFENLVQGTARDLFGEAILRCEQRAQVVLHVHDEVVQEVPEDCAEEAKHQMEQDLTTVPAWATGLPVAADVKVLRRYEK